MTEREREKVVRETVEKCAEIVQSATVIQHSRGVNGRATLERAATRILREVH